MWIIVRDSDGTLLQGPLEESPVLVEEGYQVLHVPLQTRWDSTRKTFVDAPREFELRIFLTEFLTPIEFLTLRQWQPAGQPTPDDLVFMWAREIILTLPRINLDDPNTIAVLGMCQLRGLLSEARVSQILAGIPI